MKILDNYISRRFLSVLFFSLIAFIAIFVIVDLIENLDNFINNDVPAFVVFKYYFFSLPYIIILTLPVAMLLASLFSIGNMARQNELIAMMASGQSLYRILLPLFIIAFFISIGTFFFSEYALPGASEQKAFIEDEHWEKKRESWRKRINKVYALDDQGRAISMRSYNTAKNIGFFASVRKWDGSKLVSRIDARKITWEDSVWVLHDGFIRNFTEESETATPFTQITLENENLKPRDFSKMLSRSEEMSYAELKKFVEEVRRSGGKLNKWMVELYLKIAIPFASFIIVLFGAPLSSRKRRGSTATGFGISLVIVFTYFGIVKTTQTMGHNGFLPPLIAAWIANAIFGILGLFVLVRAQK